MIKQDFNILNNNELMSLIDGLQLPVVDGVDFASDEDDEDLDDDIEAGNTGFGSGKATQRQ